MIGREFELKAEFLLLGMKDAPKFEELGHILIVPPPGIHSSYRILYLGHRPAGSRFRIVGVVTHKSKLFPLVQYVISFTDDRTGETKGKEVRIPDASGWGLYVKPAFPDEAPQLSEQYFKPLAGIQK